MAGTNCCSEGNIVGYDDMIGIIKKNCNDFEHWEVEFKNCTRIIHYHNMVFICENQAVYDLRLEM